MTNTYPHSIVPRKGFLKRICVERLLESYPFWVVARRCDDPSPFAISSDGSKRILKDDVLGNNLLQMSVNLLGGSFKYSHFSYLPKLEVVKDAWDGELLPKLPLEPSYYNVLENFSIVYFYVGKVNGFVYPYTKDIKNIDEYTNIKSEAEVIKERENLKIEEEIVGAFKGLENQQTQVHAHLKVNHAPNLYNYWHMHIDTYAVNGDNPIEYSDKISEVKRIRRKLREYISRIAIENIDYSYHINRRHYIRNVSIITLFYDCVLDLFYKKIKVPFSKK